MSLNNKAWDCKADARAASPLNSWRMRSSTLPSTVLCYVAELLLQQALDAGRPCVQVQDSDIHLAAGMVHGTKSDRLVEWRERWRMTLDLAPKDVPEPSYLRQFMSKIRQMT